MKDLDREIDIDRSTLRLRPQGIFGQTFGGREGLMVTSADYLLRIELTLRVNEANRLGEAVFQVSKRINLVQDVSSERVRECIDKMKGKIGLLPNGFDYCLGPCIGQTSEDEGIFYEIEDDWGIYRIKHA